MQASSAISFRLPPASISAAASSGSPLLSIPAFAFFSGFSGPSVPRPNVASLQLSDPRCFRILSSASVLGSDYSASALPFCFPPLLPHSCLHSVPFRFRFQAFPLPFHLVSHASLPVLLTQLRCSFPFILPCFAPTAVPQVLSPFRSPFGSLPFVFSPSFPLSFVRFFSGSDYSAFCSSFPLSPDSALQLLPRSSLPLSLPFFSPSTSSGFPSSAFGSAYSAFRSFPFVLPSFASTAVPLVLAFRSLPAFVLCFCFLSSASALGSDYSASALSFPFFPFSPGMVPSVLPYPFPLPSVAILPLPLWYSAFCSSFLAVRFASQWLPRPVGLPFGLAAPLSYYLRFRYLAG